MFSAQITVHPWLVGAERMRTARWRSIPFGGRRRGRPVMWPHHRRVGQMGEERKKMTSSSNQNGMLDGLGHWWAG
jgi:hypothetical protein